jgi:hypothetical protein
MNTPSEVGGVLARIADGHPRTLDAEGYWRLFARASNHLLPLAHPPSDLRHAINRSVAEKSMTGITTSRHGVRTPGLSRQQLRLVAPPGDGRGAMTTTPLPRTDIIIDDKRTRMEYRRLLHASGPFSGLLTSRSPTLTNMNPSRIREAGWPSTPLPPEPLGQPKM